VALMTHLISKAMGQDKRNVQYVGRSEFRDSAWICLVLITSSVRLVVVKAPKLNPSARYQRTSVAIRFPCSATTPKRSCQGCTVRTRPGHLSPM
jgi:hypothetical protein